MRIQGPLASMEPAASEYDSVSRSRKITMYPFPRNGGTGSASLAVAQGATINMYPTPKSPSRRAPMPGRMIPGTGIFAKHRSLHCIVRMKETATRPHTTPKTTKAGVMPMVKGMGLSAKKLGPTPKRGSFEPMIVWVVAAARTEATTIGVNVRSEKSRRRTSSTKKMPAMGALKTDARPAAAPQPSKVVPLLASRRRSLATFEPTTAPMVTIGPSGPADPPLPMVKVEPIHWRASRRIRSRD